MKDEIRLTRDIHNFVRGHLSWEESFRLLDEIVESEEWMKHQKWLNRQSSSGFYGNRRVVYAHPVPLA